MGGDYCQQKSDQAFLQRHGGNVVGNHILFLLTQKPFGWAQKNFAFTFYYHGTDVMCSKKISTSTFYKLKLKFTLPYILKSLPSLGN